MKPFFVALFSAAALLLLPFSSLVCADTITVGDYAQPEEFSLVHEGEEILAPFLLGLSRQGYSFISQGKTLTLRTPAGREIVMTVDQTKASIGGREVNLQAAPRYVSQRCFLPVYSLAEPLGLAVFWDEDGKKLLLLPQLTRLEIEDTEERLNVHLGAQVRLTHREGRLVAPPRVFVDIENLFVQGPQQREINSGPLLGIRAATKEIKKPGLRVVIDLSRSTDCYAKISEDGCTLTVSIPKQAGPPPAPKAFLEGVSFQRNSDRLVTITLSLSAPAVVDSQMQAEKKSLLIRIFETASRLEDLPKVPENGIVSDMKLRSAGFSGEVQEIQISLKEEQRHLLFAEGSKVRVMIGEFSLAGLKIMLDPGHGGCLSGAPGRSGLLEKDVNLDIALRLEEMLRQAGAEVGMTRRGDYLLRSVQDEKGKLDFEAYRRELYMRAEEANSARADLFISIHCNANAASNPSPRTGTEVYYGRAQSRLLAETLQQAMVRELGRIDGGVIIREKLVVTRETKMPAVLVEVAYMDSTVEERLLASGEFRARAAKALFEGLREYVESGGPLGF
jgi:N-acetylmuramoyl-L-alanine amidase